MSGVASPFAASAPSSRPSASRRRPKSTTCKRAWAGVLAAILSACARPSPSLEPPSGIIIGKVEAAPLNVIDGGGTDTPPRDRAETRSYQEALVELDMGSHDARDLTDAQLSAPTRNASFVAGCGAVDSMKVTVRVVVRDGRAVGV